ncbi:MAG: Ribonuclease R [Chlamydiae bacterium]|nr:Ribonuclease R [Chlamydiota bacterium]
MRKKRPYFPRKNTHKPGLSSKPDLFAIGTIRVHPRGFGFLVPEDRPKFPEDIFIPRHRTKGAVDGDRVEVLVFTRYVSEKGPEGRVEKILSRGRSHVAGTIVYERTKGKTHAYVPLLGKDSLMSILPTDERKLVVGDRIHIHVLDWGGKNQDPLGEMSGYIGSISDPSCDIAAAIEEYDLEEAFPESTLEEARSYGTSVQPKEISARTDLHELPCITIDPETAKDFDDALSLTKDKQGHYHLGVHIADVSHYVRKGTSLDEEAQERSNSVYFPGKVVPMLPHELSSHLCSLKPNVNRLTVSVLMTLDTNGDLLNYEICRSVIQSKKRFTYEEAKEVLDGKKKSPFAPALHLMMELCLLLKKQRAARGSIEFSLPDIQIRVDETGVPQEMHLVEYDITHQLVEEFMLKANEMIATHLSKEGKPLTYRVHEEPNPENIKEFATLATSFGFPLPSQPTNLELQTLFDQARESPFGQFLATSFIKSMKLANYSTDNIGHYGLCLEHYTHFTSPIRRYIDLVVHRLLFEPVDPRVDYNSIALKCSEKERLSAKAENAVVLLKKLRLLLTTQKSDPKKVYPAVVTQVKPNGFAFEVEAFLYEGFLFTDRWSPKYHSGEKIEVKLRTVDLITLETEWDLAL